MHRRFFALATAGLSLGVFDLGAKAQTAYIWGESQSNHLNYGVQEIFLLETDLSTGNFTEVSNSRAVNLYNHNFITDSGNTPMSQAFLGRLNLRAQC